MGRRLVSVAVTVAAGLFACVAVPRDGEPPNDAAGVAHALPYIPCTMQEAGAGTGSDCQAIDIAQSTIALGAGGSAFATVQQLVPLPVTMLVSATITGSGVFTFTDPACAGLQSCTFTPNKSLVYALGIACSNAGPQGILQVAGTNGPVDVDSTVLTCVSAGPTISVTPVMLSPFTAPVGASSTAQQVVVTNNGSGSLNYSVAQTDATQWQLSSPSCPGFPTCILGGSGMSHTFDVVFTPDQHHSIPTTETFTFNGGMAGTRTVQASGTGMGAVLDVAPVSHDFLQLPLGGLGTQTFTITNGGNAPLTANLTPPVPPFGVSQTSFPSIPAGDSRTFEATCQSSVALGPTTGTATVSSNAYTLGNGAPGGTQVLSFDCEVLPTELQVTPNPVSFGEVRRGATPPTMTVTLTNPLPSAVEVSSIALVAAPDALTITGFDGGAVPPSSSRMLALRLATGSEVDLADAKLLVNVVGVATPLAVPVRGKVVVPSAKIIPGKLDLGTVCVGSTVGAAVAMVNDGTAMVTAEMPTMDQGFAARTMSSFPTALAAGDSVAVEVVPAATTAGGARGTLSWTARALGSLLEEFSVPVDVTYISSGAALSPARLEFGEVDAETISYARSVRLENCDQLPVLVGVEGLSAARNDLGAWQIDPLMLQQTLAAHESIIVTARFRPPRSGHYEAKIVLTVEGEQRFVPLFGDGLGRRIDPASLYACSCATASPLQGLPIVLVVFFVIRRRRDVRRV